MEVTTPDQTPAMVVSMDRLKQAVRMRYQQSVSLSGDVLKNVGPYWERYRPQGLLQWAGFCGIVLLAASAVSTALNILGGLTLGLAWVGLVVYFFTVATSSVAALFCGPALMVFSGSCAVMGTCILSSVVGVYGMLALAGRARGYATPYLEAMQQRPKQQQLPPTAQMRHAPQGSPARLAASSRSVDTSTSAAHPTQLLGDVSPGKPQVAELHSPTASPAAPNNLSAVTDLPRKTNNNNSTASPSASSKALKSGGGNSTSSSLSSSSAVHRAAAAVSSTA